MVLYVSSGCCTVPGLFGMTVPQAEAALERAHLAAGQATRVTTDAYEADTVIGQDPPPGDRVEPGTEVNITFAATPPPEGDDKGKGRGKGPKDDSDDDG